MIDSNFADQGALQGLLLADRLLIFPGGNYPAPTTRDKALTAETVEYPAMLGE